jgi:dipeptidyl aminopeptidase/acylaminoacyl peptidase
MFIKKEKINKSIYESNQTYGAELQSLNTIVDTYAIEYQTPNCDETIGGYICMPKTIKDKLPVLIYIRGGASIDGRWGDRDASIFLSWLASLGYIVIMSNLRTKDELGGEEINDIYYLEELLKLIPEADLSEINMLSHSMGAINTYRILKNSEFKNKIGKVLILAGCSDTNDMMTRRPNLREYWSQYYDTNSIEENIKRSSINWINDIPTELSNLYILHGTIDSRVDYFNFENLKIKMKKYSKTPHFISLLETDHNPNGFRSEIKGILVNKE